MVQLIEKRNFVLTDIDKNSNKYWIISLFDNATVHTKYGRVDHSETNEPKDFNGDMVAAEKYFRAKLRDKVRVKKRRDAYTEITIIDDGPTVTTNKPSKHISDIAAEQINTSSEDVRKFIKHISDANIHNIECLTSIKYSVAEGSFRTPLGVVDQTCINTAKELLEKISLYVNNKDYGKELLKLTNSYLRYIPQDLGGSSTKIHLKDVFGNVDSLEKQSNIIEGLEAAIGSAKLDKPASSEKIFNTTIERATDEQDIEYIRKNIYNVTDIYRVDIDSVVNAYLKYGEGLSNKQRLWHGTSVANILSIIKNGLIIPKKQSNGRRFGDGIYSSDKVEMSLGYAPFDNNTKYLFLLEVALGNVFVGSGKSLDSSYHSRWAEKGYSTSQIIVYRCDQVRPFYLCKVKY